ncbi:MAG: Integral membrane protein CcmA involved in cell shape determination [Berkelbacteria bacterium GW2011_GWA2_35_9]|uniref:Integral membrane protein CcmA involved in cell shape determination n=1 Tax=Berkelbacteria bacterium GW2011_GWA2_35_9 TaxID=1618333 RepID=A0A0G0FKM4_9BACT|nr:MAG: Integral membrane protein CcmA involved in cell shape determination [Berkelbacteria bacterium GW2011_GWA2_35_9]
MNNEGNGEGTIVGANVKLQGTISDNNDIVIHGAVDGEVISEKNINITPSAIVKGPIKGMVITVAGTVEGDIEGTEKTEVLPTGKVIGSINTSELIIQSGAIFNGECKMTEESKMTREKKPEPDNEEPKEKENSKPADKHQPEEVKPAEVEEATDAQEVIDDFELD